MSFNGEFSKTPLGVDGTQTVDYSFDIHEYHEDMIVTVTLSRLEPVSGSGLTETSTPGVYTYKPTTAGRQTIKLQTTSTEEGTCSVTLDTDEAYGYMPETDSILKVDVLTATINSTVAGSLSNVTNGTSGTQTASVTITTGGETWTVTGSVTRGGTSGNRTYSFSISNWRIEYDDPNQTVNISLVYRNYTYTGTFTLQQLIDGDISGLTLSR